MLFRSCQNTCPVYRQIGGHAYGWVYGGPIGAVLTPLFRGSADGGELAHASTLCAACDDVCPVGIPLHDMLLGLRRRRVDDDAAGRREAIAFRIWAVLWSRPALYRSTIGIGRLALRAVARDGVVSARVPGLRRWTRDRDLVIGRRR